MRLQSDGRGGIGDLLEAFPGGERMEEWPVEPEPPYSDIESDRIVFILESFVENYHAQERSKERKLQSQEGGRESHGCPL